MKFHSSIFSKNKWLITSVSREMFLSLVIISLPVLSPETVHAGLFSIFGGLNDQASAKVAEAVVVPNSQNMALLKAAVNLDPNPNKPLALVPRASGNALLADIGPSGSISDIEESTQNTEISIYIVRSGDTLSQIASMFDVTVNTIVWANDLTKSDVLIEGQTLIILPIIGIRYTVKKGDTIKGIVLKYKADFDEVLQYNDLEVNSVISVGDIIIIPDAEPSVPTAITSARTSTNTKKGFVRDSVHDAGGPSYPGYYMRPIKGGVKTQGLHGYNSVDLADTHGTPIYASAEGVVIASVTGGWHGGYGNYIIISHPNGTQTLYAHLSKNLVGRGQSVKQGQMIANIGMTGRTTGPHVHFEIRGAKNPF